MSDQEWDTKIALSRKNYETAVAASITRNEAKIERTLAAARDFPSEGHAGGSILAITEEQYQEWLQSKEGDEA